MGSAIVLGAMLCVFFTRDLQLLAIAPPDHFRVRLVIYSTCTLAYLISFTVFLTSAGAYQPLRLFRTPLLGCECFLTWLHLAFLFGSESQAHSCPPLAACRAPNAGLVGCNGQRYPPIPAQCYADRTSFARCGGCGLLVCRDVRRRGVDTEGATRRRP